MKNIKYSLILILLLYSANLFAQLGGLPAPFSRMGFNARGIAMGNTMSSVTYGDLNGFYNPALSPFQNEHLVNLSYSFLSFNRSLNFVSYTKNFKLPKQTEGGAGVTFAWLNSGVDKIDGRDIDGASIGELSTSDNLFLFAPSVRISEKISLGVGFKLYYSKLYEGVTSTSFGFDIGALYKVNDKLNIAVTAKDFNSAYEWNTQELYGSVNGTQTKEKLPKIYTIGASYLLPKNLGIVSMEYQTSNKRSNIIRAGVEINAIKDLKFRAGWDRLDYSSNDMLGGSRPSAGIGYQKTFGSYIVGIDYSFAMEPYSHNPFQTITAVIKLK
ncbi:MAG: hypothetical protein IT280_01845 [Ignavibacteria bacterium]|nr:hypothetical protein [Ignavibacteria bacterium]